MNNNVCLKNYTTFRIGGNAKYFFVADNLEELVDVLKWAKGRELPWFLLGRGSNILVSDDGFPGLVIRLGKSFKEIRFDNENQLVTAGGGVTLSKIGMVIIDNGWTGFEYMCVIPGTVGAAVRINAGTTRCGVINDSFYSTEVLTTDLKLKTFFIDELQFSYRYSHLVDCCGIVLNASFCLKQRDSVGKLKNSLKTLTLKRKKSQPKNLKNCGSVFRTPAGGNGAGWYLEHCGLKGMAIGDAQISFEHANWIVNMGNATADNVKELILFAQETVFDKFGIRLEREVIYIPEDLFNRGFCEK